MIRLFQALQYLIHTSDLTNREIVTISDALGILQRNPIFCDQFVQLIKESPRD